MNTERAVPILYGSAVLLSLGLGARGSPFFESAEFLWIAAIAGFTLLQAGFTRFCPVEVVLRALGMRSAAEEAESL